MFGNHRKRQRALSNPALHPHAPPNSSASLAATKAFMRSHDSNASLSSSAAAAALRSHPTAPIQVGQTVTKRMARKGSVSSQGSGSQQAPALRRHSSSGSMTERTFREASPARSSPVDPDAPPVPQLPQDVPQTAAVHRRASSLEPAYRGGSPIGRGGGRGVSLDRGVSGTAGRNQPRAPALAQVPEDVRQNGPQSINFSRPISPVQTSSPKAPAASRGGQTGWFGGPVVNPGAAFRGAAPRPQASGGNSAFEAHTTQQAIQNAANRPVSTKKTPVSQGLEGARLASGSLRTKQNPYATQPRQVHPAATYRDPPRTVDPNSPFAVYDPSTRTFIHKQDAMALHRAISDAEDPPPRYEHDFREASHPRQPERRPAEDQQAQPRSQPWRTTHIEGSDRASASALQTKASTNRIPAPAALDAPAGTTLARRSSEDFAVDDDLRPAADTNVSRNLETTVAEGVSNVHQQPLSPKLASNQDSPYPRVSPVAATPQDGASGVQVANKARVERTHSLSPPRNAHFAAVSLELSNDIKHQPPPRSVSPAKSALKSSPSVSRRGHSPIANDGHVLSQGPGSEASDAISEDGPKKKKKVVRVSFDEEPVVAGTSAYADVATKSPEQGLAASRWSSTSQEQDVNDFMKPRPVLPSFGSIRDKDRKSRGGDAPEKVTETVSSSLSNSAISTTEQTGPSSDHLVGGILAQDFASKADKLDSQDPLPPEVTSVEGNGYVSDSDQSEVSDPKNQIHTLNDTEVPKDKDQSMSEPEPKTLTALAESRTVGQGVPSIAVQPASPSPTEKPEPKYQPPFLPGSWDDDDGPETGLTRPTPTQPETQTRTTTISFANIEALDSHFQDSDSSDDSSIYSDAYEDLSEAEDGGFASIDAVLERPIASPPSGLMASKFAEVDVKEPESSSSRTEYKDDMEHPPADHSPVQRQPQDSTAKQAVATAATAPLKSQAQSEPASTSKRQVNARPESMASTAAPQPRKPALKKSTAQQDSPQVEPTRMRKTMRDTTDTNPIAGSPRMKKSMRESAGSATASPPTSAMRKTMRGAGSAAANQPAPGLAASRYSVPPIETKTPRGALQKRHVPASASTSSTAQPRQHGLPMSIPSKTITAPAYDSDSDASVSSFQRSRPRASRRENGRYTMRASMRSGTTPTMRATAPSMRPTSPLQAASPPPTMRKSMRPSSPTVEVSANAGMKSSKFRIRSLSPAGKFRPKSTADIPPLPTQSSSPKRATMFGKSSKAKKPVTEPSKPRFKSRFADSSDEEDDPPRAFQSRFADSDDDDEFELPPDLAPVRGIPKRPGEEDRESTDLEDELSDAEPSPQPVEKGKNPATNGIPNGSTNGATNGQSANVAGRSLRSSKHTPALPEMEAGKKAKSKRGLFGLGKKKTSGSYIESEPRIENGAAPDIPLPPKQRRDANRPLTPIGEDKDVEPSKAAPRAPKLQRRTAPPIGRSASDSWPLPESSVTGEDARPQSSDGVVNRRLSFRPNLTKRHSSQTSQAHTMVEQGTEKSVIVGRSGKKKKFQGLRRVFGLND